MDAEILGGRLSATEEAILKIDARVDELCGKVDAWTQQQLSNSEVMDRLTILEAERQVAQEHRLAAEAQAVEALAEAQAAEAEADQAALENLEAPSEEEVIPEAPELEVIEAPEETEKSEPSPTSQSRSDLETLGLR